MYVSRFFWRRRFCLYFHCQLRRHPAAGAEFSRSLPVQGVTVASSYNLYKAAGAFLELLCIGCPGLEWKATGAGVTTAAKFAASAMAAFDSNADLPFVLPLVLVLCLFTCPEASLLLILLLSFCSVRRAVITPCIYRANDNRSWKLGGGVGQCPCGWSSWWQTPQAATVVMMPCEWSAGWQQDHRPPLSWRHD